METLVVLPRQVGRQFDLLDGAPQAALTDQLRHIGSVRCLGEGDIERVTDGAGRGFRAEYFDPVRADHGEVVGLMIRVMDQPVEASTDSPDDHVDRLQQQNVGAEGCRNIPAGPDDVAT